MWSVSYVDETTVAFLDHKLNNNKFGNTKILFGISQLLFSLFIQLSQLKYLE